MVCVCSGHSSVFGMFRADCFVRVSLQDLLPEEILQAALVAGKGGRRRNVLGGESTLAGRVPAVWCVPARLEALKDQLCESQGRKTC